jgi:two-component system nitrate/nitrite response regulator NarL
VTLPRSGQFQTGSAAYITVHIAMRNRLDASRIAKLYSPVGPVRRWRVFANADEAVRLREPQALTVLVVALDDVDPQTCAAITDAGAAGIPTLILIDDPDMQKLVQLNGLPSIGFAFAGSADQATLEAALVKLADTGHRLPHAVPSPRAASPRLTSPADAAAYLRLTPRERMVLLHLVDGLSNRQIGRLLRISENSVKRLVANLLIKMNCSNRTEVVAKTLRSHLYEELHADPLTRR